MVAWGLDDREAFVVEPKTFMAEHIRVVFSDDDSKNLCDYPGCDYDHGPSPVLIPINIVEVVL